MFNSRLMIITGVLGSLFAVMVAMLLYSKSVSDIKSLYLRYIWTALNGVSVDRGHMLSMRDGTKLAIDIYLPRRVKPPYPVIFVQTPYDKVDYFGGLHAVRLFAKSGYAVAVQDMRGRYGSEGEFTLYEHAVQDGWDTLDWLSQQSWSSGRIGTFGCSALGETQYLLADAGHPNHRAMIAEAGGGALEDFGLYEGGVLNLASAVGWFSEKGSKTGQEEAGNVTPDLFQNLPFVDLVRQSGAPPTDYEVYVSHPPGDPWWSERPFLDEPRGFSVPGLHLNSWFDLGVEDSITLAMGQGVANPAQQNVIISPASHCKSESVAARDQIGDLPVVGGNLPYQQVFLAWFDHWLKDGPPPNAPPLKVFVLGGDRWLDIDSWPPQDVEWQEWYLSSETGAHTASGDGRLLREHPPQGSDSFDYDPSSPVATLGGPHCCTGDPDDRPGSFDQVLSAQRDDVLVFQSDVMSTSLLIVGPLRVRLNVATTAADTDFTAKFIDVWPDGRAFNIQDGIFRLRYRGGYERPQMAEAGEIYDIEIGLRGTAYEILPGHRLRLEISSSNFPRLARNGNTGGENHLEVNLVKATNSVYFGGRNPSRILLPICKCDVRSVTNRDLGSYRKEPRQPIIM
jgi:putative CocE/NonD family hydrolase